jgi:hypothetical protein
VRLFRCLQEWLFKVVIRLGRDIVVLKVLLSVESDGLCLDLSFLHVDLVTTEDDRNAFANANEIAYDI